MNDDFYSWKQHPITQIVMGEFQARIKQLCEEMVEQASTVDPRLMAEKAGAIKAYQDVLDIQLEESHGN